MTARTLMQWGPEDMNPNSATFPDLGQDGQFRRFLAFAQDESCDTPQFMMPQGVVTPLSVVFTYRMTSATANAIEWRAAVECISDGDAVDTDSASSFDSNNDSGDVTVPGTAGHIDQVSLTLTNNDSAAAGDLARLRITRIAPAGTGASGDMELLCMELRDNGNP